MGMDREGCTYRSPRGIESRDAIPFQTEEESTPGMEEG